MKKSIVCLMAGLAILLGTQAHATSMLALWDGQGTFSTDALIVSDGAVNDSNPVSGVVTYLGAYENWMINVSTGISSSILAGQQDLNSVDVSVGAGELQIWYTDSLRFEPANMSIGGVTNGTVQFEVFAGIGSFGTDQLLGSIGAFGPGAFEGTGYLPGISDPLDNHLTSVVTINHTAGLAKVTSFNASVGVPEPSTLLLLGSGLFGLGIIRRRRSQG